MKLLPKTWGLLLVALVLLLGNVLVRTLGSGGEDARPSLVAAPEEQIRRIEISDAVDKVVLEPSLEGGLRRWRLVAPVKAEADAQVMRALLAVFAEPVPMDVQVDKGTLDTYGLDAGNGLVVEVWTTGQSPAISMTVGKDAPGGSSFVRLSGDESIYRARLGGRARYSARASDWRNRVPLGIDHRGLVQVSSVNTVNAGWVLVRGPSTGADAAGLALPGPWRIDPDPGWATDSARLDQLFAQLGAMRAEEVLGAEFDGGFQQPVGTVELVLEDGTRRRLQIGGRLHPQAAFVRVDDAPEVYRVPRALILPLLLPASELRDRSLLGFALADLDTLVLEEGEVRSIVRQSGGAGRWERVQPAGREVDVGALSQVAAGLAGLRGDAVVEGVSLAQAGLDRPRATLTVLLVDGSSQVLELGGPTSGGDGAPARYARAAGHPTVMRLSEATLDRIRQAMNGG